MPELTAVYRLYGQAGELPYVGISSQPEIRWKQHASDKPWWPEVARKEVAWYGDRETAAAEEMCAVGAESPHYNVMGPPKEVIALMVRIDKPVYERLRLEAFEKRTSQVAIVTEALSQRYGMADGTAPDDTTEGRS